MHLLCIKKIFLEFFLFAIIEKYHNNTIENSSQIDKYNYVLKKIISISYTTLFVYIHDLPASKLSGALWWQSRKRTGQHENNFHTFNTTSHVLAMPVSKPFVP